MLPEEFADHEKYAPKMPGHTCPIIDSLLSDVRDAQKSTSRADRAQDYESLMGVVSDIDHSLRSAEAELETLRKHNSALRECAEYWKKACEESVVEATDAP